MELASSDSSLVLRGQASTRGKACGQVFLMQAQAELVVEAESRRTIPEEHENVQRALSQTSAELKTLAATMPSGSDELAEIVHAQLQMVDDPDMKAELSRLIVEEGQPARNAVRQVFGVFIQRLENHGNAFMKERAADIKDVRDRILRNLSRSQTMNPVFRGGVLVGAEIAPTDLLEHAENIVAVVMSGGGITSHVAIIAAALGIPLVAGVQGIHKMVRNGDVLAVDADRCETILRPEAVLLEAIQAANTYTGVDADAILPAHTACGQPIRVMANVDLEQELERYDRYGAEGIGLVRTESLLMRTDSTDMRVRQRQFYEAVARKAGDNGVIIRLWDIGGDKMGGGEANPYLGWRGARRLLSSADMLDDQLEALLETAGRFPGHVKLMLPMVTNLDEWQQFCDRVDVIQEKLDKSGFPTDRDISLGLMVEVPSVALRADVFARKADFMSIGTNDLTQYILAVDRGNTRVSGLYDALHPAVLQAISMTAEAAAKAGIPLSVCGEMAGNPLSAAVLLGLGIRELSMNMASIGDVRKMIRSRNIDQFKAVAEDFLAAETAEQRKALILHWKSGLHIS